MILLERSVKENQTITFEKICSLDYSKKLSESQRVP
jgi:hypothetical protein